MRKLILYKPLILSVLLSFISFNVIPINATTNKLKSCAYFLNKTNSPIFQDEDFIFNENFFYNKKINRLFYRPFFSKINNHSRYNTLFTNFSAQSNDYISGRNDGKKLGSTSSVRDWYAWGFLGGISLTLILIAAMNDVNEATKIPVGLAFTFVPYLSANDVPKNKIPSKKSQEYRSGFSDGYKSVKRNKEMRYCFIGSAVSCLLAYLLVVSFSGKSIELES